MAVIGTRGSRAGYRDGPARRNESPRLYRAITHGATGRGNDGVRFERYTNVTGT